MKSTTSHKSQGVLTIKSEDISRGPGMRFIKLSFSMLIIFILIAQASYCADETLNVSWDHYKHNKIDTDGRPLADIDNEDIAEGSKGSYLTFSETVSYVLFRAVWINDKKAFDKTWKWAYENMMRKNIRAYNWQTKQWIELPADKRDNLFAWRWTKNINHTGKDGVIYYVWQKTSYDKIWRAGYDVAPDGDELIAGALIFAHYRWGSDKTELTYLQNAKHIMKDLWNKCVLNLVPGEIDSFESEQSVTSWFSYASSGILVKKQTVPGQDSGKGLHADARGASYMGIGKALGNADLTAVTGISLYAKGSDAIRIILEDGKGLKASLVRNLWEEEWENVIFSFSEMDSPSGFAWDNIKNIMIQPEKDEIYIDNIRLYGGTLTGTSRLHLVGNDQGEPWINISYYMPFLYEIFSQIDPVRPWKELVNSTYYDMTRGSEALMHNQMGERFKGNSAVVPDWFMYSLTGEVVDLPWAKDNHTDDYLCSWDAFRTWFFVSMHSSWFPTSLSQNIIRNKSYEFFKQELNKNGMIKGGYYISGKQGSVRGIQNDYPGINGAYLSFFHAAGDADSAKKLYKRIQTTYHPEGYWANDPKEYYNQNWAWFGLAFYKDKGKELYELAASGK